MDGYDKAVELKMQWLFSTLSEKDRRRYAGIEAAKLGHGGIEYISGLFGIDPKTVRRGLMELEQTDDTAPSRIRKKAGGRNAAIERRPQLEDHFRHMLAEFTAGDPVISIDSKRKELIGNFAREGYTHSQAPVDVLDHDFPSAGTGKLIPHGIYDLVRNEGYVHLNTSHDTSEFCCDSIALWWERHGHRHYPDARRLLLLCDGGGSNAANRQVFKEDVQALSDRLGLEIRVAPYPPYCSKHNPIKHRLFPHLTRACQGVVFHTVAIAKQFMETAKTSQGLKVTVDILTGVLYKKMRGRLPQNHEDRFRRLPA